MCWQSCDNFHNETEYPNYLFIIKCVDGGFGWGETGQIGYIIISKNSLKEAKDSLKLQLPGGWLYEFICMTNKDAGLLTNIIFKEN